MLTPEPPFSSIEDAIEDIRAGKMVVVVDDPDRENEGDLCMAGPVATTEAVNFMALHGRGLICLTLPPDRCDDLGLRPMVGEPGADTGTAFTVSIEAREGVTTGISAADRALTIRVASAGETVADDLVQPGHVFPLRARAGGVLERTGHTEASVDLARLAGFDPPAGVICEVMNADGTMARLPDLAEFALEHGLRMVTIADLIEYRRRKDTLIERVAEITLPTPWGEFRAIGYGSTVDDKHHLALVYGDISDQHEEGVLVRVHSECLTGDVFHSLRCDCGDQLHMAMEQIVRNGSGALVYLAQEGRGIGLLNKLRAYQLQEEQGLDTVEANVALGFKPDLREYGIGGQILADLGITALRVMTNNPRKIAGLEGFGIVVRAQVPIEATPNAHNERYLAVKRDKLGHLFGVHHQHLKLADELPSDPPRGVKDPAADPAGEPA